jgi:predicted nucleic acid-binding protein
MIVVCDTSPLSALASIHRLDLLPLFYGNITIPNAVLAECRHPGAPEPLRAWAAYLPDWVVVASPTGNPPPVLAKLDPGETEAIQIALASTSPVLLLMDERRGVKAAEHLGIPFVGTLGLLVNAHLRGHLDFETALSGLRTTGFHLGDPAILRARQIIADRAHL